MTPSSAVLLPDQSSTQTSLLSQLDLACRNLQDWNVLLKKWSELNSPPPRLPPTRWERGVSFMPCVGTLTAKPGGACGGWVRGFFWGGGGCSP